jgi:hypothetical protein
MPAPMPSRMAPARYLSSSELYMDLIFLGYLLLSLLLGGSGYIIISYILMFAFD